ncbi:MAG: T9SS type A sorting domain-containing protein [Bacteroidetes bacterium]|nr:T9SS type A sorting domain-containing protein [Bacteroidota bacterium]
MKSRFLTTILLAILLSASMFGQTSFKILFVNDNSVFPANTDTMLYAMSHTGYGYDYFDARDSLRSPSLTELTKYNLVIWYCSTDGVGNYFWSGNDSDNSDLTAYLETGGMLWVMGTDFLYDRYGSAPYHFAAGDFMYDYLGTKDYNVQSYGDDGGIGVPELDLVLNGFTTIPVIHWSFTTAWWVDGCTPVNDASSVYEMGPDSYSLYGYSSAIWYPSSGHLSLTFFFDPAIMDTYNHREILLEEIISHFKLFAGLPQLAPSETGFQVSPNPAGNYLSILKPAGMSKDLTLQVFNLKGNLILDKRIESSDKLVETDISTVPDGLYMIRITDNFTQSASKLLIHH